MFGKKRGYVLLQNTHIKIKGNILSPKFLWRGGKRWTATTLIIPTQGVSTECPAKANELLEICSWDSQATPPPPHLDSHFALTASICSQDSNPILTFHQGKTGKVQACSLVWFYESISVVKWPTFSMEFLAKRTAQPRVFPCEYPCSPPRYSMAPQIPVKDTTCPSL